MATIGFGARRPISASNSNEGGASTKLASAPAWIAAVTRAIGDFYQKLRADGTTLGEEHRLMTFAEFNALIGVDEKYALAERFGVQ